MLKQHSKLFFTATLLLSPLSLSLSACSNAGIKSFNSTTQHPSESNIRENGTDYTRYEYVKEFSPKQTINSVNSVNGSANDRSWDLESPPSIKEISKAVKNDTANDQLKGVGEWWLFGPGLGHSILNIGTAVLFPPYALYLLGNAGLALAGEEPIRIVNILPEGGPREAVNNTLDGICSVPGRITSGIAQRPYVETLQTTPQNTQD